MLCKFVILALAAAQDPVPDNNEAEQEVVVPEPNESEDLAPKADEPPTKAAVPETNGEGENADATHTSTVDGHAAREVSAVEGDAINGQEAVQNDVAAKEETIDDTLIPGAGDNAGGDDVTAPEVVSNNSTVTIGSKNSTIEAKEESSASAPAIFVAALVLFAL